MGDLLPELLRTGAVIRVAAGPDARPGTRTQALTFVDLRFEDGHVERWMGPGAVGKVPDGVAEPRTLTAWGEEVFEVQMETLLEELSQSFGGVTETALSGVPVEIFVEWNHDLTWLEAAFKRHNFPKRAKHRH